MGTHEYLATWLEYAERGAKEGFGDVTNLAVLPGKVLGGSQQWAERIFRPDASPYNPGLGVKHGIHLGTEDSPDLLRHEYRVGRLDLSVLESNNFMLIRVLPLGVKLMRLADDARRGAIHGAAEALLAPTEDGCARVLQCEDPLGEGACFSTDPHTDPSVLRSCMQRVDGTLRSGRIHLLCFKRDTQTLGFQDMRRWFDTGFRERWNHAKGGPAA